MTREELLAVIAFLETLRSSALSGLGLHASDPYWNLTLYLMRRHLEGKPVSVTGLAAAALVPYGSAMRRIDEMIEAGLIFKRTRTASGRSFSVHPTTELIHRFEASMMRVKRLLAMVSHSADSIAAENFYSEGCYAGAQIIASPSAMKPPIGPNKPVRILVQDDPTFQVLTRFHRELQEWLGGKIELTVMKIDQMREETLANAVRSQSAYDIVAVDVPWTGEYAAGNLLLPLSDCIGKDLIDPLDFHPTAWQAAHFDGVQYAIPIQTTPELLFYRTDLFEEHGLRAPATTEDLLTAARTLTLRNDDRYGIAWRAGRGSPCAHSFVQFMGAFGSPPIKLQMEDGEYSLPNFAEGGLEPAFDTDVAQAAAEFMLDLKDVSVPNVTDMDSEESIAAYTDGRTAMVYGWSCRVSRFELSPNSPARGVTAYLPHPHGPGSNTVSPMGGYLLGIPANLNSTRIDLAARVINWLVSAEAMKFYVQNGSFTSPRFSVSADPHVAQKCEVIGAVDRIAKKGQIKLWPRPPAPGMAKLFAILGEEIHDMLLRRQSVRTALNRAQDRGRAALAQMPMTRISEQLGAYRQLHR